MPFSTSVATAARCSSRARATASRSSARTTRGRMRWTVRYAPRRARNASRTSIRRDCPLVPLRLETLGAVPVREPGRRTRRRSPRRSAPLPELLPVDGLVFHSRDEFEVAAELEDRVRELPRVLPLPGRAQGLQRARTTSTRTSTGSSRSPSTSSRSSRTRARRGRGRRSSTSSGPNLRINVFAGAPNLSLGPLLPAGPERSSGFLDYFFAPDARSGLARRAARLRPAGRRRGSRARRAGAEGSAVGRRPGGAAARGERAARGALPGARE